MDIEQHTALALRRLLVHGLYGDLPQGHTALGIFGIIFPFLWLLGAIMPPKPGSAYDKEDRARLGFHDNRRLATGGRARIARQQGNDDVRHAATTPIVARIDGP